MESLGIWLIGLGVADLVASPGGDVKSRSRALLGAAVGAASVALVMFSLGNRASIVGSFAGFSAVTLFVWLEMRRSLKPTRAWLLLIGLLTTCVGLLFSNPFGFWPTEPWFGRVLEVLTWDRSHGQLILGFGVLLVMQGTGNGFVRLVLSLTGTQPNAQTALRGGRLLGPMERTLLFALGVAGQGAAIGLLVAAKGLMRFPELSQQKANIHEVTEYFLVGSMASWIFALVFLPVMFIGN